MIANLDSLPRRPLLVLVMATAVWGSLTSFESFRASLPKPEAVENVRADAHSEYAITITLTFDAQGDAFSPLALRVSLDGVDEPLFESNTTVRAGVPVLISPVAGIKVGVNELLIEVGSGADSTEASLHQIAHAIRVQVRVNEEVIVERTLWSEPGNTISGLIVLDVPENTAASAPAAEHEGHQH
ncbi:MAG: hypothetical protein VB814_12410 [Pirellulaceae bacterium]